MKIKKCSNCENECYSFTNKECYCKLTKSKIENENNCCEKYREFISYDKCLK